MIWEFATAVRIVFGPGRLRELGALIEGMAKRVLVVTGGHPARAGRLLEILRDAGVTPVPWSMTGEPTLATVTEGISHVRSERCDAVIGFGGGSVIDAAKAIAILATNDGDLLDYLEVVGRNQPLQHPGVPFIAVPTTAGTGAEVTRNAVIGSPEHRVKASLRSPLMLAKLALVDPELTHGLPSHLTASTGLDALTQLIEPLLSIRANPLTDGFCREGLPRVARSLHRAWDNGHDAAARADMAFASLLGGLALANAGLGAVHGFAAPIGGMFPAPHGAVCGALLPHVMAVNLRAATARDQHGRIVRRFDEIAQLLAGDASARAADGVEWVARLTQSVGTNPLRTYGISRGDFDELAVKAANASSMKANPLALNQDELREILERAL